MEHCGRCDIQITFESILPLPVKKINWNSLVARRSVRFSHLGHTLSTLSSLCPGRPVPVTSPFGRDVTWERQAQWITTGLTSTQRARMVFRELPTHSRSIQGRPMYVLAYVCTYIPMAMHNRTVNLKTGTHWNEQGDASTCSPFAR